MRCNRRFPPWWDKTITLYNKVTEGGKIVYYRHVLRGCSIAVKRVSVLNGSDRSFNDEITVRIPQNDAYRAPIAYDSPQCDGKRDGLFTLHDGDVILFGAHTEEMRDEAGFRPGDRLDCFDGFTVRTYADNSQAGILPHYKAGA